MSSVCNINDLEYDMKVFGKCILLIFGFDASHDDFDFCRLTGLTLHGSIEETIVTIRDKYDYNKTKLLKLSKAGWYIYFFISWE